MGAGLSRGDDRGTDVDDVEADEAAPVGTVEEEADEDDAVDADVDDADAGVSARGISDAEVDGPGNWSSRLELPRAASENTYIICHL